MARVDMDMARRFAGCDADDPVLTACVNAAEVQLESAGVPAQPGNPSWEFAVAYMGAYLYDMRGSESAVAMPPVVQGLLHQLRCVEGA